MTWALQDAKNKFSALSDAAWQGRPQIVTRHGKPIVVVISYKMYEERIEKRAKPNLWEAFRNCPVDVDLGEMIPGRSDDEGRAHKEAFDAVFA